VQPAQYFIKKVIFTTCPAQVQRLKAAQVHSSIFGVAKDITSGDVDEELARVYRFFSL
jgi:hypothetical protein